MRVGTFCFHSLNHGEMFQAMLEYDKNIINNVGRNTQIYTFL